MARIVKVGAGGGKVEWKDALKDIKADDVLMLEPGFYVLEQGLDVANITIKGTGSSPEDTVIEGYFSLNADCSFFTMENACLETKSSNNAIYVENDADTYLTLRNSVIRSGKDNTAGIAVNGKCTLELFSVKIFGASLSLFEQADFRVTMNDTLIDYPSESYSALGIQGKGTAIISNSKIQGAVSTYPGSNAELDINNSQLTTVLVHGSTWMNMLNSHVLGKEDSSLYISDDSWVNIIRSIFEGGVFLDKKTRTIMQNSRLDRIIACNDAKLTLNNVAIISHADFQDQAICDATRTGFSGSDDFEYFLALNSKAELIGKDLIFNPNNSVLAVQDDARIKLNVLSSADKELEVECNRKPNVNIIGLRWQIKKDN